MKALYKKYILNFKQASGTSRGILRTKETFFLKIIEGSKTGYGECGLFRGLSIDDRPDYEAKLQWVCNNITNNIDELLKELIEFPSIQFGLEQAIISLKNENPFELFPSKFTESKDALEDKGELWVIGNRHLAYHAKLKHLFGDCDVVASNKKFTLLKATKK